MSDLTDTQKADMALRHLWDETVEKIAAVARRYPDCPESEFHKLVEGWFGDDSLDAYLEYLEENK